MLLIKIILKLQRNTKLMRVNKMNKKLMQVLTSQLKWNQFKTFFRKENYSWQFNCNWSWKYWNPVRGKSTRI